MEQNEIFQRTELLLGAEALEKLHGSHVAVFGIGGVGGYVVEALARSGVGAFTLVDSDVVSVSNLNRQIIATLDTVGQYKTEIMAARIARINPDARVTVRNCFYLPETADSFDFAQYDYVVDAVDTVTAKLEIICRAQDAGVPVISSMGAGNKLDPTQFRVADVYETSVCPLAKVMRHECRKRGIKHLKCVYSTEEPRKPQVETSSAEQNQTGRRSIPGSIAFVPSVAGLILAGEVVRDLIGERVITQE